MYKIFNKTTRQFVGYTEIADTFWSRLEGLLGKKTGILLLIPCRQVHSFFMRFTFDAIFLDKDNMVIEIVRMRPFRISPYVNRARAVLEMPDAGLIQRGDTLEIIPG